MWSGSRPKRSLRLVVAFQWKYILNNVVLFIFSHIIYCRWCSFSIAYSNSYRVSCILMINFYKLFVLDGATFLRLMIIHFKHHDFSMSYCNSFPSTSFFFSIYSNLISGVAFLVFTVNTRSGLWFQTWLDGEGQLD